MSGIGASWIGVTGEAAHGRLVTQWHQSFVFRRVARCLHLLDAVRDGDHGALRRFACKRIEKAT